MDLSNNISQENENDLQDCTSLSTESMNSTSTTTSSPSCSPGLSRSASCEYDTNKSAANNVNFPSARATSDGNNLLSNISDTNNTCSSANETEGDQTIDSISEINKLNENKRMLQEEIQILLSEKDNFLSKLFLFSCINGALERICQNLSRGFVALKFIQKNKSCNCNEHLNKQYDSLMLKYQIEHIAQRAQSTIATSQNSLNQFNGSLKKANEANLCKTNSNSNLFFEFLPHDLSYNNRSGFKPQRSNTTLNYDFPFCSTSSTTGNDSQFPHVQNQIRNQSNLEATNLNKMVNPANASVKKKSNSFLISSLLKSTEITPSTKSYLDLKSSSNALQQSPIENAREAHDKNNLQLGDSLHKNEHPGIIGVFSTSNSEKAAHFQNSTCFNEFGVSLNEKKTFPREFSKIPNINLKCEWPECNRMFDNEEIYLNHRNWHIRMSNFQCTQQKYYFEKKNLIEHENKKKAKYHSNMTDNLSPLNLMSKVSENTQLNATSEYSNSSDEEVEVAGICKPKPVRIPKFKPSMCFGIQSSHLKPVANIEPYGSQSFQSSDQTTRSQDMMGQNEQQKMLSFLMPHHQTSNPTVNPTNTKPPSLYHSSLSSQRMQLPWKFSLDYSKIDNSNLPLYGANAVGQSLESQNTLPTNGSLNSPHAKLYQQLVFSSKNSLTEIAATAAAAANKAQQDKLQTQSTDSLNNNGTGKGMDNFDPHKNYLPITADSHELNINKRSQYSGIGRYQCPWPDCRYTPYFLRDLRRHMFKHTGDRKFKCKILNCKFDTVWKTSLLQHYRKIHKDNTTHQSISSCYDNDGDSSTNEASDKH